MPIQDNIENNTTLTLNVIDGLDMGIHTRVQEVLSPVYEMFPSLTYTIFGIPFANLIAATLVFFVFLFLRNIFTKVVMVFLQQLAKKTTTYYDDKIISALKGPLSFTFIILGIHLFFLIIFKETETVKNLLGTLIIYTVFWAILSILEALRGAVYGITGKFSADLSKEMGNFIIAILKRCHASGLGY
jgi:MscS family membrane protein